MQKCSELHKSRMQTCKSVVDYINQEMNMQSLVDYINLECKRAKV